MDFVTARQNMIDCQLRPNKVSDDDILARFMETPRELFVDASSQDIAYVDQSTDIGHGRVMYSPMVAARLVEAMAPKPTDHVMVVAAGTGYTATILAPLVEYVVAVEENAYLVDNGRRAQSDLHLKNVKWVKDKPEKGCKAHAPYDCIVLDAAADLIPESLVQQVKEGGRIIGVLKGRNGVYQLTIATRNGATLFTETLFETPGVPLANFKQAEKFVF